MEKGLTPEEVSERSAKYGFNEVPEKKTSALLKFAAKFWGITPWMLEFTIVMEWILGKYFEAYIIVGLLIFNAVVGFAQEQRASGALELLRQRLRIMARVKRDGLWSLIPARGLVPGDVIRLRAGDFVPADIKIVEGFIEVDQSALTGESMGVERKMGDALYSGSIVRTGESTGIVSSTGRRTYYGRTVELVQVAKPRLHMEEAISKVVKWLLVMVGASLALAIGLALLKGMGLADMAPLAVILLVSAIPVALPTMFTISMALGSLELSRKGALVTRLDATEDAATMDVLCVDKTGTMTVNRLTIADVVPVGRFSMRDVILYGALASQEANQDPIDVAFIDSAKKFEIHLDGYVHEKFTPFNPLTRRTEAMMAKDGEIFFAVKGAVDVVCGLCKAGQGELNRVFRSVETLSSKGYRVIAVAQGISDEDLELVGIAALNDRLREDSADLIRELKSLGVSVKMLTGDALPIAKEIAVEAGLGSNVNRISDLKNHLNDEKILRVVEESDGFAEIYPEDKYLIVKSLQGRRHVVGMTGDGVNDAPALRQAEVGIAVSSATDVAKKSSSVVLTVEGLSSIIDLVKGGRMVYQRIASWVINKIIRTFKRVLFIVLAFVLTGQFVVSTFNMILLLFLSDYVTLSISTDRVRYSRKPESWDTMDFLKLGVLYGVFIVAESMLMLYIGLAYFGLYGNIDRLHTFVFVWLTLSGYFTVISIRERRHFWDSRPSWPLSSALIINSIIVFLISTFGLPDLAPISILEFATILAYSFVSCLIVNDLVKMYLAGRFEVVV